MWKKDRALTNIRLVVILAKRSDSMKTEAEILDEYLKQDTFFDSLEYQERLLYKIAVLNSIDFQKYLLKIRFKELIKSIKESLMLWK